LALQSGVPSPGDLLWLAAVPPQEAGEHRRDGRLVLLCALCSIPASAVSRLRSVLTSETARYTGARASSGIFYVEDECGTGGRM